MKNKVRYIPFKHLSKRTKGLILFELFSLFSIIVLSLLILVFPEFVDTILVFISILMAMTLIPVMFAESIQAEVLGGTLEGKGGESKKEKRFSMATYLGIPFSFVVLSFSIWYIWNNGTTLSSISVLILAIVLCCVSVRPFLQRKF